MCHFLSSLTLMDIVSLELAFINLFTQSTGYRMDLLSSRATTSRFLPICCSLCNLFSLSTCLWLENLNLLHFHPSTACISDFNNVRQQGLSLFFTTALCLMFRDPVNVNFGRLAHSVNNMTPSLLQLLNWANGEMEINNNSAVASLLPHICTQKAIRFDNESVSVVKAQWLCMHFIKWFVVSCCWANRRTNERFSLLRLSFSKPVPMFSWKLLHSADKWNMSGIIISQGLLVATTATKVCLWWVFEETKSPHRKEVILLFFVCGRRFAPLIMVSRWIN